MHYHYLISLNAHFTFHTFILSTLQGIHQLKSALFCRLVLVETLAVKQQRNLQQDHFC